MSKPDVAPGTTETQQMRILAPPGVSHLSIHQLTAGTNPSPPPNHLQGRRQPRTRPARLCWLPGQPHKRKLNDNIDRQYVGAVETCIMYRFTFEDHGDQA